LGLGLVIIGAFMLWDAVLDVRLHGGYVARYALLAPSALLVGPWLLVTGTLGARTLPESPVWHRVVAALLAAAGFVWGITGFEEVIVRLAQ
jgi:hypothetical protein